MIKKNDWTKYVHEYSDPRLTKPVFVVAEYNAESNTFECPLDARTSQDAGADREWARNLCYMSNKYFDRSKALRRARYLFGKK